MFGIYTSVLYCSDKTILADGLPCVSIASTFIHYRSPTSLVLTQVRGRVKEGFHKQAGLTEELDIKRAVNRGRWWTREMVGVIQLKKYRRMRHSYKPFE